MMQHFVASSVTVRKAGELYFLSWQKKHFSILNFYLASGEVPGVGAIVIFVDRTTSLQPLDVGAVTERGITGLIVPLRTLFFQLVNERLKPRYYVAIFSVI